MALGNNLKKEKLIPTGTTENLQGTSNENATTMGNELQTAEPKVKAKGNGSGNGHSDDRMLDMKGQLDAINQAFFTLLSVMLVASLITFTTLPLSSATGV